jgi:outer membrane protein assembly factor BamB
MRRFIHVAVSMFALTSAALSAEPATWPRFNGPRGDGWSPATGINKDWKAKEPAELWRVDLGDKGYAGAASDGVAVFIIDHEKDQDVVRALDLERGTELWRFAYADNGEQNYGFARATPALSGGHVFTLGRLGQLHCLDAKTGAKVWNVDIQSAFKGKAPQWHYAASPIIVGSSLIVAPGGDDAAVVALDPLTGKTIWSGGGSDKPGYATPVVRDTQLVLMTCDKILEIDGATGKQTWSFPWKTNLDANCSSPLLTEAGVFVTSGYGTGCAMLAPDGTTAKEVWRNKLVQSHMSSPVLHQGFIYATTDPGALVCLEAKTGAERWRQKGFGKGALMAIDGCLIVTEDKTGEGVLVELNSTAYRELGRIQPFSSKGDYWTQPVVAAGRLLLRSKTELVCLDIR